MDKSPIQKRILFQKCQKFIQSSTHTQLKVPINMEDNCVLGNRKYQFSLLDSVIRLSELANTIDQIVYQGGFQFREQMLFNPEKRLIKMLNFLFCFCQTKSQQLILQTVKNIMINQMKILSILYQLKKRFITYEIERIIEQFACRFNTSSFQLKMHFFKKIICELAIRLFQSFSRISKYQQFLELNEQEGYSIQNQNFVYFHSKITVLQAKRQILLKDGYKSKAIATNIAILKFACDSEHLKNQQIASKIPKVIESCLCILIDMDSQQPECTKYRDLAQKLFQVSENLFEPLFYTKIINTVKDLEKKNNELQQFRKWATGDIKKQLQKVPGVGSIINRLLSIRESLGNKQAEIVFTEYQIENMAKVVNQLGVQFPVQGQK